MLVTDSPVHDAVRAIWTRPFSPAAVAGQREAMERLADDLLRPFLDAVRAGETVDFVPLFERFAGKALFGLFDFIEIGEEDFRRWYKLLLDSAAFSITPDDPLYPARCKAKAEVYAMLEAELDDRQERLARGENGSDIIALIASSEGRSGITRRVILDNLFNVFTGGADTTVRWMGNAVAVLCRHPGAVAELRASPELVPQALEEVMRLESVTRFAIRTVTSEGTVLGGQQLARGDTVYLLTSTANRDPATYENPGAFNIHRRGPPHLGFSHGMHKCIGMHLARVEAQALIGRLIAAAPDLEVAEVDYGDTAIVKGPQYLLLREAGKRG